MPHNSEARSALRELRSIHPRLIVPPTLDEDCHLTEDEFCDLRRTRTGHATPHLLEAAFNAGWIRPRDPYADR